ncbi:TIGR03009 domain-containing protein [Frigoriglobus tundricola]|uniref:Outer membrane lipoprotein-sorting protein n=1 Tax=Frigoriglobus tundricola TaxID=2774151 RepID=A0A6M5YTM5_9BACT|nr:TIGR03009 domain-containing protein [Frigoriglobus tundricola]QJW96673.1 hypothetical protein FTUN_4230 [Frigoriglobus tundricola]
MRLTCTVLAVLMLAACPPRRSRVVYVPVQPCVQPLVVSAPPVVVAQAPPPHEPSGRASDPAVEALLAEWERKMADVRSLRMEIAFKRTDPVFKKDTHYSGSVLWLKPHFVVLRLENSADPTKTDYEAYICDGKSIFAYNGVQKTITEIQLPLNNLQANEPPANDPLSQWLSSLWTKWTDHLLYQALIEIKAKDVSARFDITLFKKDEHYLYLDIKPRSDADKREFQHIRVALYGPEPATQKWAYLPAQVYVLRPSMDAEVWKFTNPQVNLPGVDEKNFTFVPIKGWDVKQVPAQVRPDAKP